MTLEFIAVGFAALRFEGFAALRFEGLFAFVCGWLCYNILTSYISFYIL
jgi:hypothetical protein